MVINLKNELVNFLVSIGNEKYVAEAVAETYLKNRPQDTTLEEDGELDVTPGKWYVGMQSTVRSNIEGDEAWKDSVVCVYSGGNEDNAYLIAQAKNMYAMLKKLIADHDETSTSYLSEKRKNIELAKQLLNNCKPKP